MPSFISKYRSLLLVNLFLVIFALILSWIKPINHLKDYRIERIQGYLEQEVYGDKRIDQIFVCNEQFDSLELYVTAPLSNYHGSFIVSLYDGENTLIERWVTDKLDLIRGTQRETGWIDFPIRNAGHFHGNTYRIVVEAPELDEENEIRVGITNRGSIVKGEENIDVCSIDGEETEKTISFSVYGKQTNVFCIVALLILFVVANVWWFNRKAGAEKLAPLVLLGTGLMMFLIMAPSSQPDEIYHYNSAMKLSNVILGEKENIQAVSGDLEQKKKHLNSNESFMKVLQASALKTENKDSIRFFTEADSLKHPQAYLAPALGMTLGRLLKLNQIYIYELARLFTMLSYIGMVWLAVKLMPTGKQLLLLICVMPMCMHQAVSTSRDVLVIGMSMIFFAYYMKIIHEGKPFSWKETLLSAVMLAVFGPVKVIYCVLAFLILLVPGKQFRNKGDRIIKSAFVLLFCFVYLYFTENSNINHNLNSSNWVGRSDYYHLSFVFEQPVRFAHIMANSMLYYFWGFVKEAVGDRLAGLTISISEYWVIAYLAVMLLSAVNENDHRLELGTYQRWMLLLFWIMGFGALTAAFFFSNTLYGDTLVAGMQGRYLIPFLPLLLFAIRGKRLSFSFEGHRLWYAVWFIELGYIVDVMSQIYYA